MLCQTPPERMTDAQGRPYFLWDSDLTLVEFRRRLQDSDPEVRAYLTGKLMRQAKPDDVFLFVRPREIQDLWPRLERYLGRTRDFWKWLFVDLVSEPFGSISPPEEAPLEGSTILVDGAHEIMASKLATLLERSELRDLVDLQALLDAGGDLTAALRDAPLKDAGFSPLTLAWVIKGFDVAAAGRASGWTAPDIEKLAVFKDWLVDWLTEAAAPDRSP